MSLRLRSVISTKLSLAIIIAISVLTISFTIWKAAIIINDIEKNTIQIQINEDRIFQDLKER